MSNTWLAIGLIAWTLGVCIWALRPRKPTGLFGHRRSWGVPHQRDRHGAKGWGE